MVFSGIAIGFMGFGVWAHHMFASGLGPVAVAAFSVVDDAHRRPHRREDLQLDGHHVGRRRSDFTTPMLFAIGFVAHVHDRRPLRRHARRRAGRHAADRHLLHRRPLPLRALRRRASSASSAASTTGGRRCSASMLNETLGKVHFWLMIVGFNLTFCPMHILGLQGMSRRDLHLPATATASTFWNLVSTIGAFIIALAMLVFLVQRRATKRRPRRCRRRHRPVGRPHPRVDASPRPPPAHNFDDPIPIVTRSTSSGTASTREDERRTGRADRHRRGGRHARRRLARAHLPAPSYWPLRARGRPAAHRLRPDLQPGDLRRRRRHRSWSASAAGRSSRPTTSTCPRTATTTARTTAATTARRPRRRRMRPQPRRR